MKKYKFIDIEEHFLKRLNNVKEILNFGKDFEAGLLALCYLDALSNLFIDGNTTKNRFINLLFSHGSVDGFRWDKVNWAEFNKIERNYLKSNICPFCYEKIRQYIDHLICRYEYSNSSKCVAQDEILAKVIDEIITAGREKSCKCNIISKSLLRCLYDSTYGGTLYREYRCESVHKAKFNMLWSSLENHFEEPYYVDIDGELPDFSIPSKFIVKTLENCLANLKSIK